MQRIEKKKIVGRKAELSRAVSWSKLCSDLLGVIRGRLCLTDQARFQVLDPCLSHVKGSMQRIEEKKMVGREAELNRAVSWSELCLDLLGDIMGRLCVTDQARFHAVCKSWRHVCPINKFYSVFKSGGLEKRASLFSWCVRVYHRLLFRRIGRPNSMFLEFHLYDPYYSVDNPLSVHTISLSELGIPNLSSETDIRIISKYNWLFITFTNRERISFTNREHGRAQIYFILFSPLTKTLKQLPPCLDSSPWYFEQSFSSDPESADCVFLLLDTWSDESIFTVSTYRKDDKEWTVRQFAIVYNFLRAGCKTMYTGGIFYIVSPSGQVASYNVITQDINYESSSKDDDLAKYARWLPFELFILNGEVMYTFCDDGISCTKRFDRSNKVWIRVSSLQDLAIIANEKPQSVANIIEFFSEHGCLICSSRSSNLELLVPCLSPRFIFGANYGFKSNLIFWIKPPLIH